MEISKFASSAELGMDDPLFFNQWPLNSFPFDSAFFEDVHHSQQQVMNFKRPALLSHELEANRPLKMFKTNTSVNSSPQSSFHLLDSSFAKPIGVVKPEKETWSPSSTLSFPSESNLSQHFIHGTNKISTSTKLTQPQDHILAERKRREKLSQKFIALSVLVPGLKKTDKATVLGDAIEYIKELQKKVKILDEETNKKKTMESVVYVKKYELHSDCEDSSSSLSSSEKSFGPIATETLPQVEARFCNKDILIHIHCEKAKGTLEKIVVEIEKLHLSAVNSSVMTFGDSTLDITIITQKDEEFNLNTKEVVKKLRCALKIFM